MITSVLILAVIYIALCGSLRVPSRIKRSKGPMMNIGLLVGASSGLVCYHPSVVKAVVFTGATNGATNGAAEALQLLNGYETHIPYSVTWFVLLAGGSYLLFEFYKLMASL